MINLRRTMSNRSAAASWIRALAALGLCLCASAQADVAEVEFLKRWALHVAAPWVGSTVPDLVLVRLDGRPVALTSLRGQTLVLIRAGYTSQAFRDAVKDLNRLQKQVVASRSKNPISRPMPLATFLVVVREEPAAGIAPFASVAQPKTFAERCALAERMRDELDVAMSIYVDDLGEASKALFAEDASPVVVIDPIGRIVDKLSTPDAAPLERALQRRPREPVDVWGKGFPEFENIDAFTRQVHLEPTLDMIVSDYTIWEMGGKSIAGAQVTWQPVQNARFALTKWSGANQPIASVPIGGYPFEQKLLADAYGGDPMRLLAARVEFATTLEHCAVRSEWKAIGELPAEGAFGHVRAWIEHRNLPEAQQMLDFDEAARERVRARLAAHVKPPMAGLLDRKLAVLRVEFDHGRAYALEGAERLGVRFGRQLALGERSADMPEPPVACERTALVEQTFVLGKPYEAAILEIANR